jgi:monodechloroaminopyrrolnitrin synthase PrnB-like protein
MPLFRYEQINVLQNPGDDPAYRRRSGARMSDRAEQFDHEILALSETQSTQDWFQRNARAFLEVCDLFGQTAAQHHDLLVRRFIERPAAELDEAELQGITASGPPLPVLLRSLEMLRDQRIAAKRSDLVTRHEDLANLRALLKG